MSKWSTKKSKIGQLRDMQATQGVNGNWNHDSYMLGLFNGLEMALALYEDREPEFRSRPEQWGADLPLLDPLDPANQPQPFSELARDR